MKNSSKLNSICATAVAGITNMLVGVLNRRMTTFVQCNIELILTRVCVCVCKQIVSIASLRNTWKLSTILKTKKVRAYWAVCENAIENTSCAKCFHSFDVYRYWLEFGKSVYLLLSWSQSSGARIIDTPNVSVLDSGRTRSKRTSEWTEGNR